MSGPADTISSLAVALLGDVGEHANKAVQAPTPGSPWWFSSFRPFGFQHFLPAGAALVGMAILSGIGVKLVGTPGERKIRLPIAWTCLAYAIFVSVWYVVPPHLNLAKSLPLQMCDIMVLITPIAMITRARWLRTLACFWGVALCTQAFMTPILTVGLGDAEYYFFWVSHAIIIGTALYDYTAGGFRPTGKDYAICVLWGLAWIISVFCINLLIDGANYGYVGDVTPKQPTIVPKLGAWPRRAVLVAVIAIGACGVVLLGSKVFERFEGPSKKRWPVVVTIVLFFVVGCGMIAAGILDAMHPRPPMQPAPAESAPSPT